MKTLEQAKKDYAKNIANAKKIKKLLEKSGMRPQLLESCNHIIKNYALEHEMNLQYGLYDYCNNEKIMHLSMYDGIFEPVKIKTFSKPYLELVKKRIENGNASERLTTRGKYDYSIFIDGNRGRYNREYIDCGNGYYYLMLNHDTALFYEKD